ncbi:MAG: hypothetical protein WD069_13660 [Planctomycetales bacterium]
MASETVRIDPRTHAKLKELAARTGEPMTAVLERAVDAYRRREFLAECNRAYARLKADPKAWAQEEAERKEWETTLSDGLEDA